MNATRKLVALDGSPAAGGSVAQLLEAVAEGARDAGGEAEIIRCATLNVRPCIACGPDPTPGYCIFHDDMDRVYAQLEAAHAVVVGSPIYFDGVSAQLKLVIDRCNCITPLHRLGDGREVFQPRWRRTRRGLFVTACGAGNRHDLAERSVRGFLKWVGARWEESLVWEHADNLLGSVSAAPELLERARGTGRRLIESPAHAGDSASQ